MLGIILFDRTNQAWDKIEVEAKLKWSIEIEARSPSVLRGTKVGGVRALCQKLSASSG